MPVYGIKQGQLIKLNSCTCPNEILTYNCVINTTVAGGFTIWQGEAFTCPNEGDRILLRHNSFDSPGGAFGRCSNGAIKGRSLPIGALVVIGNTYVYTSQIQINLTANPNLIGRMLDCIYSPNGNTRIEINTSRIDITGNFKINLNLYCSHAS